MDIDIQNSQIENNNEEIVEMCPTCDLPLQDGFCAQCMVCISCN